MVLWLSGSRSSNTAAGKGGKANGWQGTGKNNNPSQECLICGKPGHKWKKCWFKDEKDPKNPGKTKGEVLEAKGGGKGGKGKKGKDGKMYRRSGVNSWKEAPEEESGGWQDGEDNGMNRTDALGLGSEFEPLEDEDDGYGCCKMFQELADDSSDSEADIDDILSRNNEEKGDDDKYDLFAPDPIDALDEPDLWTDSDPWSAMSIREIIAQSDEWD